MFSISFLVSLLVLMFTVYRRIGRDLTLEYKRDPEKLMNLIHQYEMQQKEKRKAQRKKVPIIPAQHDSNKPNSPLIQKKNSNSDDEDDVDQVPELVRFVRFFFNSCLIFLMIDSVFLSDGSKRNNSNKQNASCFVSTCNITTRARQRYVGGCK